MARPYRDERSESLKLKGLMLTIYLQMLKLRRPVGLDDDLFSDIRHQVKNNLDRMEKMGVISQNSEGKYLIAKDKLLDTMLVHLCSINTKNLLRHAFYSSFLFTSFIFFISYVLYLPQTDFTTKSFALSIVMFSTAMLLVEILQLLRHRTLLNELTETT